MRLLLLTSNYYIDELCSSVPSAPRANTVDEIRQFYEDKVPVTVATIDLDFRESVPDQICVNGEVLTQKDIFLFDAVLYQDALNQKCIRKSNRLPTGATQHYSLEEALADLLMLARSNRSEVVNELTHRHYELFRDIGYMHGLLGEQMRHAKLDRLDYLSQCGLVELVIDTWKLTHLGQLIYNRLQ